ncbi:hypothetical protein Cgig2_001431 [Carnegiea gigantea]|uniref:Uncharacterized protein n=1 Tax=Carnegiea gigantea TaxID=171969 RepID=A0A9Q1QRM1_9CARY|nr:hypothetical protein Cgig2_001431 [Carnegiea gigantea]
MNSNSPSPKQEDNEPKAEFRKLTNDAANRKYRRRSPVAGSSDEEGSRKREHYLRGNSKVSDQERRNDDRLDEKSSSRSQRGDNADSYRHSSRSYHSRHDDYPKHGKYADDEDRIHAKSSSRSGRDSRGGTHSDRREREGDYNRSRDHHKDVDRFSRDRSDAGRKYKDKDLSSDRIGYDARRGSTYDDYDRHAGDRDHRDEKRDYRSSRGHRNDRTASYEDSRGHHSDSTPKREIDDLKDLDGSKYRQPGKNKNDGSDRHEARHGGGGGGKFEDMSTFVGEDIAAKKPKLFSVEENDARKGGTLDVIVSLFLACL